MSKELKQFYRDLQAWIDAGMPESREFSPDRAICPALQVWTRRKSVSGMPAWRLAIENEGLFISRSLEAFYPFNDGKRRKWSEEGAVGNFYQNQKRLAFIKEMAE